MPTSEQPLREALEPWLVHSPGCGAYAFHAKHGNEGCDCGLEEALSPAVVSDQESARSLPVTDHASDEAATPTTCDLEGGAS